MAIFKIFERGNSNNSLIMVIQNFISQPVLLDQLRKLGGLIFNQVDRAAKSGDYVYDSQLRQLLGMLNTLSWKHETLEDTVDQAILLGVILGVFMLLLVLGVVLTTIKKCRDQQPGRNNSDDNGGGTLMTKLGNNLRQTVISPRLRATYPLLSAANMKSSKAACTMEAFPTMERDMMLKPRQKL